jgi:predicted nucleotidyltransferase
MIFLNFNMKPYQDWQKKNPQKARLLATCVAAIRQIVPDAEVILYGSVARGDERPDSDIDLLVLVPQEVTHKLERAISDQIYDIELETDQIISLIVRQSAKWHSEPLNFTPLYRVIEREGVPV